MFKRQSVQAFGPGRSIQWIPVRVNGVRQRSQTFSGSARQGADEQSSGASSKNSQESEGRSYSSAKFSKTRQQRAAQISEEVQMLSRDTPAAQARDNNSPYPAVRSRNIDAEAVGRSPYRRNVRMGGQMGNNESAEREGPNAQSAGRLVSSGAPDEVRSERSIGGAVDDPADGGTGIIDFDNGEEEQVYANESDLIDEQEEEDDADDGYSTQHEMALLEHFDREQVGEVSFDPDTVSKDEYLRLGGGGATIAANNFEGVIEDRIKLLTERTQDGFRWAPEIAERMLKGDFVNFKDEAEKEAVIAAANRGPRRRPQKGENATVARKRKYDFAPLPQKTQDTIIDKLVRGKYADPRSTPFQQDILNQVARATFRNGTYLDEDGSKLLNKVRSLLPAQTAKAQPKRARK